MIALLLLFGLVTTSATANDILNDLIPDRPSTEHLPPLEYPAEKRPPGFTLPPAQPQQPDQTTEDVPRLIVKQFRFSGNTAFSDEILQTITAPYQQRPITPADLETLRHQLTQHYIEHGYTNSGALLPKQVFSESEGIIHFKIIEGTLSEVQVSGTGWLRPEYVQNRLQLGAGTPLDAQALQEHFQLLLTDPLIERMDGRLMPGSTPGQSLLDVKVTRARPYQLALSINNYNPPGIGAEEVRLDGWLRNLSGFGDFLSVSLGLTEGRFNVDTSFAIPLNRYDTLLTLRFANSHASFIEGVVNKINIKNDFRSYDLTLTQPVYRTLRRNFTLSARLSVRRSRSELLRRLIQLDNTRDDISRVSALRLTQEYIDSQAHQVLSFRSTFSIGINAFNATWLNGNEADSNYMAWLGQLHYARRVLDNGAQIRLRGNVQLTKDKLFSFARQRTIDKRQAIVVRALCPGGCLQCAGLSGKRTRQ